MEFSDAVANANPDECDAQHKSSDSPQHLLGRLPCGIGGRLVQEIVSRTMSALSRLNSLNGITFLQWPAVRRYLGKSETICPKTKG